MLKAVYEFATGMCCIAMALFLLGGCVNASVGSKDASSPSTESTSGSVGEDPPWRRVSAKAESEVIGANTVGTCAFRYREEGPNQVVEWAWRTDKGEVYRYGSTTYDPDDYVLERSRVNEGVSAFRDTFCYDNRGSCIRHIEEIGKTLESLEMLRDVVYWYNYDDESGTKTIFEYVDGKLEGTSTLLIDAYDPAELDGAGQGSVGGIMQQTPGLPAFDGDSVTGDGIYRVMDDKGREMQEFSISSGEIERNDLNIYSDDGLLLVEFCWWIPYEEDVPCLEIITYDYENAGTGETRSGHEYYLKRYAPDAPGQQPTMEMVLVHPQEILREASGSESAVNFTKVQVIDDPVSYGLAYDPSVFDFDSH